ncbi:MAG TPA: uroporphyrinogen decarboxylase family protein [Acidimicrobiia bacterium]|jgi:acetophenone carboxylase
MPPTPRARVRLLSRSGRAQPGLFAPLVLAQAAEIEALPLAEFLGNPTKLAKGLTALHQALATDAVVTAGADGLLAEAAGAELDWNTYPPVVISHPGAGGTLPADVAEAAATHPRVAAAVEATARLAATLPGDPALVAALTGPATLAAQLGGEWFAGAATGGGPEVEAFMEAVGQVALTVTKRFLDAGANLVVLVEEQAPPEPVHEAWRSAVTPLANVTRFHQGAPVMVFESAAPADCGSAPPTIGLCAAEGIAVGGPPVRVRGVALPPEPKEWIAPAGQPALVITAGVVPGHCAFAETLAACGRLAGR